MTGVVLKLLWKESLDRTNRTDRESWRTRTGANHGSRTRVKKWRVLRCGSVRSMELRGRKVTSSELELVRYVQTLTDLSSKVSIFDHENSTKTTRNKSLTRVTRNRWQVALIAGSTAGTANKGNTAVRRTEIQGTPTCQRRPYVYHKRRHLFSRGITDYSSAEWYPSHLLLTVLLAVHPSSCSR